MDDLAPRTREFRFDVREKCRRGRLLRFEVPMDAVAFHDDVPQTSRLALQLVPQIFRRREPFFRGRVRVAEFLVRLAQLTFGALARRERGVALGVRFLGHGPRRLHALAPLRRIGAQARRFVQRGG